MRTVRVIRKTEADGSLSLRIPLGRPEAEYEVLVVVRPMVAPGQPPEQRGWPAGYFDRTYGSIDDETFVRHPQGELPQPVEMA